MYNPIDIASEDVSRLQKFEVKQQSVQGFVQQVVAAGERRNEELLEEGRKLWGDLRTKYNLDLEHINYALKDGQLVPLAVKLT